MRAFFCPTSETLEGLKQRQELWKGVLKLQVMLSKYAHIGFEVTDNMTMFELDSVTMILNEHFEEMKKSMDQAKDNREHNIRTVSVNDLDLDALG